MSEDVKKEARMQALKIAIEQIEKQHGRGAIMKLDGGPIARMDFISTGSISLDAALGIVVIDSVAALTPRAEIEGEMGDPTMGVQARLMSQALRKLTAAISKSRTCVIFTNQLRMKIGIMFGNPETTTGGMALKFYASVRLDIRRIEAIK